MLKPLATTCNRLACTLSRRTKRWILIAVDSCLFFLAIYSALGLRFEAFLPQEQLQKYLPTIALLIPVKLGMFYLMGMYRPVLRYAGLDFLHTTLRAIALSSGLVVFLSFFFRFGQLPRSVLINDALLTLLFVIGVRLSARWLLYHPKSPVSPGARARSVIVYGAGSAGSQLARALTQTDTYCVVAFVDDDPQLHHQQVCGATVYTPQQLPVLIARYSIKTVLLAMPSVDGDVKRRIIHDLRHLPVSVKTVPSIGEIVSGGVSIGQIREIDISDLLGREEVAPFPNLLRLDITEKSVLVTGAGGSIGSELCRQIASQQPRLLVLFELNELALYTIDMELSEAFPDLQRIACLGSVTDGVLLREVVVKYGVETIYHAAAYKHVPLVELNPTQGVLNNVWGTFIAARTAKECGVDSFVLISTDKAVRPTSIMGTTKRVAELILQAFAAQDDGSTRFVMVRFGNVLNSNGSVVPRFRKQIAEGRAITITHPEITRYFMSIPEAARLVVQAGALGRGGEVFLLDMGEPVKIFDLAVQMIELSGLEPGKDIDIEIVGLRPGEKLYEELLIEHDNAIRTQHPKIYAAREAMLPWTELEPQLMALVAAARQGNRVRALELLQELVPEYGGCDVPVRETVPPAVGSAT
ncbi:polysaccharide biosynthesis protein [Rubidibacter lacunae]|nr:nucleoside-diphosphate sugar epimerase/dehydratase [Rubidibacter lacunae]